MMLCFTPKGTNETCAKCPFHKIGLLCKIKRDRAALDLIYNQKAKIEALQMDNEQLQSDIVNANMNLEHIQYEYELLKQEKSVVIAEAIKEFAERLKGKAEFTTIAGYRDYCRLINALVKEMTEDNNESQNT